MATTISKIKKIADKYNVRVETEKDDEGDRIIVLYGFLSDVEAVVRQTSGYHTQRRWGPNNFGMELVKW